MNREKLLLAAGCAAFLTAVATAQAPAPPAAAPAPPPFKNLQVFPKNIGRPELISNMKVFAQSLGVRCTHCHVGTEGQPLSTFDFASDAAPTKLVARKMLAMAHRINQQDFGVTDFKDVKVTCFTCHRGSTKPLTAPPPDVNLVPPPPAPAPKASERG
jgi:cytochrome c peroxidase